MMKRNGPTEFSPGLVRGSTPRDFIKRFPLRRLDKPLLFTALALAFFGTLMIYSATRAETASTYFLKRQLMYVFIAVVVMFLAISFDYRKMMPYSKIIYGATVVLLLAVFIFPASGGAHRWLPLGFFDFQPSEFSKLAVIIILATFMADNRLDLSRNVDFLKALGAGIVPMVLIFLEPDLGVALSIFFIVVGMMLIGGARARQMVALGAGTLAVVAGVIQLGVLKSYQINRLLVFIKPDMDPLEAGYNLTQSKIAIGSGQLLGKGLFQGTQTNLEFVPAHHTDFIFSVVGEELGFIGSIILLVLFAILLWRALKIAVGARDSFGTMLAVGILVMFLLQILVNIGMTMGIMPVTGITLPFMSYGGSSLIASFLCVGLLLNVGMHRFPKGT
jgi:rod shape determining protein RodA